MDGLVRGRRRCPGVYGRHEICLLSCNAMHLSLSLSLSVYLLSSFVYSYSFPASFISLHPYPISVSLDRCRGFLSFARRHVPVLRHVALIAETLAILRLIFASPFVRSSLLQFSSVHIIPSLDLIPASIRKSRSPG